LRPILNAFIGEMGCVELRPDTRNGGRAFAFEPRQCRFAGHRRDAAKPKKRNCRFPVDRL